MAEVFLSYSREDRPIAQAIAVEMQRLGVDVWWDHELLGGDDYRARIAEILGRAVVTVVIWSRRSVGSQWVVGEASAAREKKTLVPINLDGTEPPLDFRPIHSIDFSGWVPGDQLSDELLKALGERLGRALSYSTPPDHAGSLGRYARQAAQSWYLDFEAMLFFLIAQGLACFLSTLPVAYIQRSPGLVSTAIEPIPGWLPYAFSLLLGALISPLVMRPVLKSRRLPVAATLILLASLLSVASYQVADMLLARLQGAVLLLVGPATMLFLLTTALAERTSD